MVFAVNDGGVVKVCAKVTWVVKACGSVELNLLGVFPQRVHLDIQVGEHANNYAEIAAKDKLTELQLRVRQLVEQVDQIQKEQNYQRVRSNTSSG